MEATRFVFALIFGLLLIGVCMSRPAKKTNVRRHKAREYEFSAPSQACGFQCNDGSCIPAYWECDGIVDCSNKEDEDHCGGSKSVPASYGIGCPPWMFECYDGTCLPEYVKCNGYNDCSYGEDENWCPNKTTNAPYPPDPVTSNYGCPPWMFECYNGTCLPEYVKCNGYIDCSYGEDENWCPNKTTNAPYPPDPVTSNYGCPPWMFECYNGTCLPEYVKCNGYIDCSYGEDENWCPSPTPTKGCNSYQFTCNDGSCIPSYWLCDGIVDCSNHEDEIGCANKTTNAPYPPNPVTSNYGCPPWMFECYNGTCLPEYVKCNGYIDCSYGEDENWCPNKTTNAPYPPNPVTSNYGCPPWMFECYNGTCLPEYVKCNGYIDCSYGEDENWCPNKTTNAPYPPNPVTSNYGCPPWMFECYNGTCLPEYVKCNGYIDCSYGEDENWCPGPTPIYSQGCNPDQFTCDDGKCIPSYWKCDGIVDCSNKEDETGCGNKTTGSPSYEPSYYVTPDYGCPPWMFECYNGTCLPEYVKCNGYIDCSYGEDEYGCNEMSWLERATKRKSTKRARRSGQPQRTHRK
ncbi:sortilin-related receptor-like isoform X2 [Patiria miniata]|uniref:Uncharacterized protein n=1 Tax=Patiria miniata TaxID=46514 RepID=A0A913ZQ16_PATMI|nr:sortilin-related receptor-like isoform X2 [Patiria miniata]